MRSVDPAQTAVGGAGARADFADSRMRSMALEARARQSLGASSDAIHAMVVDAVERLNLTGARVIDVGCGHGALRARLGDRFHFYRGLDAWNYSGYPPDAHFTQVDLDGEHWGVEPQ